MMRKRVERTLTELYRLTEKITQPEITPVLEGNCRIQGPVDESDHELGMANSADKNFTFTNKTSHMRVESGTCNVCSAPCSSCMHDNRTLLATESTIECGSSRNSCAIKEADSCSFICADGMPLYTSRICDECAVSEASNFVSANSSDDSDSENAESKATLRASTTCVESEDMLPFQPLGASIEDQILQEETHDMDNCLLNSHVTYDLCYSTCPNKDEQQVLECLGDNRSCITGTEGSNNVGQGNLYLHKKNGTCPTLTDTSLPRSVENTMHDELTDSSRGSKNEGRQSNHRRKITSPDVSFEKKCVDSTNAFSGKSDFVEVHLPICISSPKIQSQHAPSQNGHVVCHSGDHNNSDGSSDCQRRSDGESSLGAELSVSANGKKKVMSDNGNNKATYTENGFSADVIKITDACVENENALGGVIKYRSVNDKPESPSALLDVPVMQEPSPLLQQVMAGGSSESEAELTDVKICDICGDAGREELLAVCSRCSDGAEHTYCMRKMMRKIPEGDWLCEECQLKDDAEMKKVDMPENVSATAKQCKVKDYREAKVDMSGKLSETEKDCKLKDRAEVKKGFMSEAVSGISQEFKKDDVENHKKDDKFETVPGTPKPAVQNAISPKFVSTSNLKVLPKLDVKAIDRDMRKVSKGLQSPKIPAKRHVESQEILSSSSKKNPEISVECMEVGSPRKKHALSRESSFKNMPTSNGCQSPTSSQGFSHSQSLSSSHLSKVQAQLQPSHGLLSRSSSVNNSNLKPKVKHLTESIFVKPKITREHLFNDTRKEALARSMIIKSASFKSLDVGCSNTESASKNKFIHQSHVENPRCLKWVKERNTLEKKSPPVLDHQPTDSSPRAGTVTSRSKMDVKTAPHDVKLNNALQPNIHRVIKGSNDANGLGRTEANKHQVSSAKILGSASLNAKGNSDDQRPGQTSMGGALGSSSSNDKFYTNAKAVQHQCVVQSAGSTHRDDKTKDPIIFSNSRHSGSGGNRILRCLRCNESGHATQFCSIDKVRSSALKPLAEKNSNDGNKKGNRWKDAVQTTISNSRLQKKNRQNDHVDEFPVSIADLSTEVGSEEFPCSSSNHPGEIPPVAQTSDGKEQISKSSNGVGMKTVHGLDVGQQSFPPTEASCISSDLQTKEASCTSEPSNLNAPICFSDELNVKHFLRILPDHASVLANPRRSSAIPEIEFIWQGSLEVLTTGNEHTSFDGIQAHLSASTSPRVHELATKFPCSVPLEEASWISSWPLQFQGISPDEHDIALFFFAKDVESYERSYSKLLDKMLKNDLALSGFIDGVQLFIFPSTKLPVHSQRWNRLFFLWGIFRGRKVDSLTSKLSSGKRTSGPILDRELAIQDLPCALRSVSQTAFSVEIPENKSARCDIPPEATTSRSITHVETWADSSPIVEDRTCRTQDSPVHISSFHLATYNSLPSAQNSYLFPMSHSPSNKNLLSNLPSGHPESRSLVANTFPCLEVQNVDSYQEDFDSRGRLVNSSAHLPATDEQIVLGHASSSYSVKGTSRETSGMGLGGEKMKSEDIFYDESQETLIAIDQLSWEKSNRKHMRSCSTDAISHAPGETSKNMSETVMWKDEVDYFPNSAGMDNGRERKNMFSEEADARWCLREESSSARLSSKVHPMLASFLSEQPKESRDGECLEAIIPGISAKQAERLFFPTQPSPVQNTHSKNLIHVLSSDDEDAPESETPDLELALGGKWRVQKKRKKDERAEDGASALLSLSLASSHPRKEWPRPISKTEQHLQDVPDLNTPLPFL